MNKRIFGVLVLFLLNIMLAGCLWKEPAQNDASVYASTITVQKQTLNGDSTITGRIEALQTANVVSKVPGKVAEVKVDIGSFVRTGQELVVLDASDLMASVKIAQAAVENAQINYDLSAKSYERARALLTSSALSQADFDNIEGQYLKAQAALNSAQATLEKAQIAYNDTIIKAPFKGYITARNINPGELAGTQTPVVAMANLEQVVVRGTVSETLINSLKINQVVKVKVPALSSSFDGKIINISPAFESQTRAYPVKVLIDNPDHLLKPGMFAEITIPDNGLSGLIIPKETILQENDKKYVFKLEKDIVKKTIIETGPGDDKSVMITAGLDEGDIIVASEVASFQDGQKVKPQNKKLREIKTGEAGK
ncbi:MAG: efflux RND transporter periplasmic adaptor subunit [Desulfotomaculaceae bacterium]|nr:efflux RND transporter periplasmic adaptor subunit [Desulfotomaculaceae bacterium]